MAIISVFSLCNRIHSLNGSTKMVTPMATNSKRDHRIRKCPKMDGLTEHCGNGQAPEAELIQWMDGFNADNIVHFY
jgi:hypothetical protein